MKKLAGFFVSLLSVLVLSNAVLAQTSQPFVTIPSSLADVPKWIVTGIFPTLASQFPAEAFQGLNIFIYILAPIAIYAFLLWDFFTFVGFPTQESSRKWLAVLFTLASLTFGIIAVIISWIWIAGSLGVVAFGGLAFILFAVPRAFGWGKSRAGREAGQDIKTFGQVKKETEALLSIAPKIEKAEWEMDKYIGRLQTMLARFKDQGSPSAIAIKDELNKILALKRDLKNKPEEVMAEFEKKRTYR